MPSVTPADVLAQRRRLYAPDAVIEAPFAPPGAPSRLVGREVIREYSRRVVASPLRLEDYEVTELYQTQDPEVVIVEMRGKGTVTTTGRSFTATSIQVLRIRDGQIVLFRDFANPQVVQDVLGGPGPEADAARNTS
jgi:ketosteroid isomerase-like protein